MYSRNKGMTDRDFTLTPPPGYDGSRFRRRSDGRDDAYPLYSDSGIKQHTHDKQRKNQNPHNTPSHIPKETPLQTLPDTKEEHDCQPEDERPLADNDEQTSKPCRLDKAEKKSDNGIISFLQGLKSEDILLIALIVLLAGGEGKAGMETVLILALLLCIR